MQFILFLSLGLSQLGDNIEKYGYGNILTFILLQLCRLEKLGGLEWYKVVHGHQGWRLVSCIWLHAGVIHLLANMLSLVFIGIRLEQQFGFGMSCLEFNPMPT